MPHERMSQSATQGRFEQGVGRAQEAYTRAHDLVEEHPGYSALVCFGIGLGVGAALTLLLRSEKPETKWYEDYLPDEGFARDVADQVRTTVRRILPDAIARYFKDR